MKCAEAWGKLGLQLGRCPRKLVGVPKPESTDGRREGWASWDEGAYKGETLASIGTDVSRQRVFSSRAEPRERSMDVGNRVIVEIGRNGMHSRTGEYTCSLLSSSWVGNCIVVPSRLTTLPCFSHIVRTATKLFNCLTWAE